VERLAQFLTAQSDNDKPYLVQGERSLSYREANRAAGECRAVLRREGVGGQNVAILAGNSIEYAIAYWAALLADNTNIPVNPKLTDPEIRSEIPYCDCNWLVAQTCFLGRAMTLARELGMGVFEIGTDCALRPRLSPAVSRTRQNGAEVAIMLHTSGTMGAPKKVMLTHRNLIANTASHIASLGLTAQDATLVALPLAFGYCNCTQLLCHTRLGGTIVFYDRPAFSAPDFCALAENRRISCFTAVPTMLFLLNDYRYLTRHDLSGARYVCFGGGEMPLDLLRAIMEKMPATAFVQTYGQTECSPRVTALLKEDALRKIGSVGKPIPGVCVEIVDENDREAAAGEIGEIRVKGANTTPGYYKNPEETRKILRAEWLYTGDLARRDSEGFIYLVGRKRNIIISGGINIYPEEIEKVLLSHPAVEACVVTGKKDRVAGEIVVASVKTKDGRLLSQEDVYRFLSDKLAAYKWPRDIVLRSDIEKTPTGKTKRVSSTADSSPKEGRATSRPKRSE
jgi:long-chain acyl-CoA synthetase